ncbi:hypothetical protein V8C86DRAFT_454653 [Haematococcus lacustris]
MCLAAPRSLVAAAKSDALLGGRLATVTPVDMSTLSGHTAQQSSIETRKRERKKSRLQSSSSSQLVEQLGLVALPDLTPPEAPPSLSLNAAPPLSQQLLHRATSLSRTTPHRKSRLGMEVNPQGALEAVGGAAGGSGPPPGAGRLSGRLSLLSPDPTPSPSAGLPLHTHLPQDMVLTAARNSFSEFVRRSDGSGSQPGGGQGGRGPEAAAASPLLLLDQQLLMRQQSLAKSHSRSRSRLGLPSSSQLVSFNSGELQAYDLLMQPAQPDLSQPRPQSTSELSQPRLSEAGQPALHVLHSLPEAEGEGEAGPAQAQPQGGEEGRGEGQGLGQLAGAGEGGQAHGTPAVGPQGMSGAAGSQFDLPPTPPTGQQVTSTAVTQHDQDRSQPVPSTPSHHSAQLEAAALEADDPLAALLGMPGQEERVPEVVAAPPALPLLATSTGAAAAAAQEHATNLLDHAASQELSGFDDAELQGHGGAEAARPLELQSGAEEVGGLQPPLLLPLPGSTPLAPAALQALEAATADQAESDAAVLARVASSQRLSGFSDLDANPWESP